MAEARAPTRGALGLAALRTHLNRWSLKNREGFLGKGQKSEPLNFHFGADDDSSPRTDMVTWTYIRIPPTPSGRCRKHLENISEPCTG